MANAAFLCPGRFQTGLLAIIAMATFLVVGGWLSPEEVVLSAEFDAPVTEIRSEFSGQIQAKSVGHDVVVRPGMHLLTLRDESLGQRVEKAHADVAGLEAELQRRRARAGVELGWRIQQLNAEILQLQMKTAEYLKQDYEYQMECHARRRIVGRLQSVPHAFAISDVFQISFQTAGAVQTVSERKTSAIRQHETTRNDMEVARVQMLLCDERLRKLKRLRAELPDRIRQATGVESVAQQLALARNKLERLRAIPQQRELAAAEDGRVVAGVPGPGTHVTAGEVLAQIVHEKRKFLRVNVPAAMFPRFSPGKTIQIRFANGERGVIEPLQSPAPSGHPQQVIIRPATAWPRLRLGAAVQVVVPRK